MKNKFGFVLIKPQIGENIGASARSIKKFWFFKIKYCFIRNKIGLTDESKSDFSWSL